MEKTEQQKRFEAAMSAADKYVGFAASGVYINADARLMWQGFQLGEASALERAAKVCDAQHGEPECPERAKYCAEAIRALAQEVGK